MDVTALLKQLEFAMPRPIDWDAVQRRRKRERDAAGSDDTLALLGFCTGPSLSRFAPCSSLLPDDEEMIKRVSAVVAPLLDLNDDQGLGVTSAPTVGTATPSATTTRSGPPSEHQRRSQHQPSGNRKHAAVPPDGATTSSSDAADVPFDYSKSIDIIRSNSSRALQDCVSALDDAQHKQYSAFVASYLQGTLANRIPEQEALLDVIAREQTMFLQKWQDYVIGSPPFNRCYLPEQFATQQALNTLSASVGQLIGRQHSTASVRTALTGPEAKVHPRPCLVVASREVLQQRVSAAKEGNLPPPEHKLVIPATAGDWLLSVRSAGGWPTLTAEAKPVTSDGALTICFDSLVALATSIALADESDNAAPLAFHVTLAGAPRQLVIGDVLPNESMSRAQTLRRAYTDVIANNDSHSAVLESGPLSGKLQFEALFQVPLSVSPTSMRVVVSHLFAKDISEPLVLPIVKLHYLSKPRSTEGGAGPAALNGMLEEYSKAELIRMHLALSLIPQAQVAVYHVDAFTGHVLNVETFTPTTFSSSVWTPNDVQCTSAWGKALNALKKLSAASITAAVPSAETLDGVLTVNADGTAVLLNTVSLPWKVAFETESDHNARRGYLAPALWPFPHRVPFTFLSRDANDAPLNITRGKLIGKALLVKKGK